MSQLETGNPDQLHTALLMNYDNSETGDEAFRKLQQLKPSPDLNSVSRFLREAKRLKELLNVGSDSEKARCFQTSCKAFLPMRLKHRMADKSLENYSKTNQSLPWNFLTSFMSVHRDEIEDYIAKLLNNPNVQAVYGSDDDEEYSDGDLDAESEEASETDESDLEDSPDDDVEEDPEYQEEDLLYEPDDEDDLYEEDL